MTLLSELGKESKLPDVLQEGHAGEGIDEHLQPAESLDIQLQLINMGIDLDLPRIMVSDLVAVGLCLGEYPFEKAEECLPKECHIKLYDFLIENDLILILCTYYTLKCSACSFGTNKPYAKKWQSIL